MADGLIASGRWRELPEDQKAILRRRLALKLAHEGKGSCTYESPGDMAVALDKRQVQRPHLERIDQAFRQVRAGEVDRIAIATPPQVGKSVRAGVWAPFWYLAHNPTARLIMATYGTGLANARGRAVRGLIEQHGADYGLVLDQRTTAANDWTLTCGGAMRSVGVGSGLTGHPGDIAVVDDPHKDRAEADSPTIRDNIAEWWSSTLISRLSPGAPVVLIQTRWHPDDLMGRLLSDEGTVAEGGRWLLIELPALAIDHVRYEDGSLRCSCEPGSVHDPLGRLPGEPLPHPKISLDDPDAALRHWEDKKRSSTIRDWAALYQADPTPAEGALLDEATLRRQRFYDPVVLLRKAVALDPSGGGRDEVGLCGGGISAEGKLYWTHDRTARMGADSWGRAACQLAFDIGADVLVYEHNYGGDQVRQIIGTAWEALSREGKVTGLKPRIKAVHAKVSKTLRAEPVAQAVIEDRIRLGAPLPHVEAEWSTWQPGSDSPGRIDATSYLAYELLTIAGSTTFISNPAEHSRRDYEPASFSVPGAGARPTAVGEGPTGLPSIFRRGGLHIVR